MPAHLVLKDDEDPSAYPLDKPIVVIGRSDDCDIVIRKTMKISRRHCCIAQVNGKLVIRDLGSMNGMKVNGERVLEEELHEGDEVQLGDLFFTFTLSSKPAGTIRKSGQKPAADKQKSAAKAKPSPPLDLSLDFPQMIPDEDVDEPTPVKSPGVKSLGGKSSSKSMKAKSSGAKSSGNNSSGKSSGKKSASKQAGLLDSGDLDVGSLELD